MKKFFLIGIILLLFFCFSSISFASSDEIETNDELEELENRINLIENCLENHEDIITSSNIDEIIEFYEMESSLIETLYSDVMSNISVYIGLIAILITALSIASIIGVPIIQNNLYKQRIIELEKKLDIVTGAQTDITKAINVNEVSINELNELRNEFGKMEDKLTVSECIISSYILSMDNQTKDAIMALEHAFEVNPRNTITLYNLGVFYHEQGSIEEAIKMYLDLLKLEPNHFNALVNLGAIYGEEGLCDNELEMYKKAIILIPNDICLNSNMAKAYFECNDNNNALKHIQIALKGNEKNEKTLLELASLYDKMGKHDDEINTYYKILTLNPDSKDALFNLVCCYTLDSNFTEALRLLNELLDTGMNDFSDLESDEDLIKLWQETDAIELVRKYCPSFNPKFNKEVDDE